MTLTEFLLARIAEDQSVAEACAYESPWTAKATDDLAIKSVGSAEFGELVVHETVNGDADHIARWDPTRVLAECEAKRRIVQIHTLEVRTAILPDDEWDGTGSDEYETTYCSECYGCGHCREMDDYTPACPTLRLLALPYADHPDYRQEWRP